MSPGNKRFVSPDNSQPIKKPRVGDDGADEAGGDVASMTNDSMQQPAAATEATAEVAPTNGTPRNIVNVLKERSWRDRFPNLKVVSKARPSKVEVLVTVVNKVERMAANAYLEPIREGENDVIESLFVDNNPVYIGQMSGERCAVVQTSQGTTTRGGAAHLIDKVMNRVQPRLILAVGVGFGVAQKTVQGCDFIMHKDKTRFRKTRLCDVLINDHIIPYDWSRENNDDSLTLRNDVLRLQEPLRRTVENIINDGWSVDPLVDGGDREARAFMGAYLSGNKLVDSEAYVKKLIKATYPNHLPVGGDMEISGIAAVASSVGVPVMVVKAICDFALDKAKEFQPAAARCAFEFVKDNLTSLLKACPTNPLHMKSSGLQVNKSNLSYHPMGEQEAPEFARRVEEAHQLLLKKCQAEEAYKREESYRQFVEAKNAYNDAMTTIKEEHLLFYNAEKLVFTNGLTLVHKPKRPTISQSDVADFFDPNEVSDFFDALRFKVGTAEDVNIQESKK